MTILFEIVYATKTNGTHHKLAMDALHHLENDHAKSWQRLFMKHVDVYLEGAKAPDKDFKDFKNHVLHVGDQFWGGAPAKASAWYDKFVRALKDKQFEEAVYCAGVLSHYYTDPLQPFHTAQSEAENNMHRAVEWSISKSYNMLRKRGKRDYAGLAVETGDGEDWVVEMVQRGAARSHQYYDALISNYNLDRGVVEPLDGLNENCHRFLSELLIYASLGFSRILDRAFLEAAVSPPEVNLTLNTFVASIGIPLRWVLRKLDNVEQIRAVHEAYDELQSTGKVEKNLNEDDRVVRNLYQKEVVERRFIKKDPQESIRSTPKRAQVKNASVSTTLRKTPQPSTVQPAKSKTPGIEKTPVKAAVKETAKVPAPISTPIREQRALRFYLDISDKIERAPSIGKKTAARLERDGINTVAELLAADPLDLSTQLNTRWTSEQVIKDWQDQSRLVCEIAGLRGGNAQILVAAGLKTSRSVATMNAGELHALLTLYCQTKDGQNLRACESVPSKEKVESWIKAAIEHPRSVAA